VLLAEDLLQWRRALLLEGGRPGDLDWLLDLGAGVSWPVLQSLWLHPGDSVQLLRSRHELEQLWRRHCRDAEPLQYLVGRCPWRDLELEVAPGVLIPRQETELLVDLALQLLPPETACPSPLWADLGTGSGCLAVALAQAMPAGRGLAADVSPRALAQAAANIQHSGVAERVQLLRSHWWEGLAPWSGQLQLVLANPPYIPSAEVDRLDPVVRDHEPRLALDGGHDGLAAIREIAAGAGSALAPGGVILLEHHHDQSEAVQALLCRFGLVEVSRHKDLEGIWRFASGRRPATSPGER
jgi:release factor glutamine methyltransferase